MTSKEVLGIILCLGEKKGLKMVGKCEDEPLFSRISFSFNGKVFENVLLKYKRSYKVREVASLIDSSLKIFLACEKKESIFRRIVNGLWK